MGLARLCKWRARNARPTVKISLPDQGVGHQLCSTAIFDGDTGTVEGLGALPRLLGALSRRAAAWPRHQFQ